VVFSLTPESIPNGTQLSPEYGRHAASLEVGVPDASLAQNVSPCWIAAGFHVCPVIGSRSAFSVGSWLAARNGCCPEGRMCISENAATRLLTKVNAQAREMAASTLRSNPRRHRACIKTTHQRAHRNKVDSNMRRNEEQEQQQEQKPYEGKRRTNP
jgi:hypothetical protein